MNNGNELVGLCTPEMKLGRWRHNTARPNIGTTADDAWIWDDGARLPWKMFYGACHTALYYRETETCRTSRCRPACRSRRWSLTLGYDLAIAGGETCRAKSHVQGVMPPRPLRKGGSPSGGSSQFGRVIGITMLGESHDRDRLPRPARPLLGPAPGAPPQGRAPAPAPSASPIRPRRSWPSPCRMRCDYRFRVLRHDRGDGRVGHTLRATGSRLSGMMSNQHNPIDSTVLIERVIDGHGGHEEDQDMRPFLDWAAMRRGARRA